EAWGWLMQRVSDHLTAKDSGSEDAPA
ncbi:DUF447 domain-containing protein, partial [Mesorhizobium sp. M7A.F.Ca.MR.228.00.0.0]